MMPAEPTDPLLSVEKSAGVPVVKLLTRDLCGPVVEVIGDQLFPLVEEHGWSNLHLDLRDVELVTGAGLGKLVALDKRLRANGGRLTVLNPRPLIHEVFEVTRLTQVLKIQKSEN